MIRKTARKLTVGMICITCFLSIQSSIYALDFFALDSAVLDYRFELGDSGGGMVDVLSKGLTHKKNNGLGLGFAVPLVQSSRSILSHIALKSGLGYSYGFAHNGKWDCNDYYTLNTLGEVVIQFLAAVVVGALGGEYHSSSTTSSNTSTCETPGKKTLFHMVEIPLGLQFRQPGWGATVESGSILYRVANWSACGAGQGCPQGINGVNGFDKSLYSRLGLGYNGKSGGIGVFVSVKQYFQTGDKHSSELFHSWQLGLEGHNRF